MFKSGQRHYIALILTYRNVNVSGTQRVHKLKRFMSPLFFIFIIVKKLYNKQFLLIVCPTAGVTNKDIVNIAKDFFIIPIQNLFENNKNPAFQKENWI